MNLTIDFNKVVGKIKPMHGVGQGPLVGTDTQYFHYLKDANIPYARLHDVGGWFGGNMWVDIPNIFRNFEADENDENSYDFTFTDLYLKGLIDNNVEPYYRLGVTIENFHEIKAYRIFPPKNYEKWARICEHIIRHYNEGWANGFHYNIKHWEIWNEPDNTEIIPKNNMWRGTKEQYFELYAVTSKHLKKCFGDKIKVGGYACTGLYIWGLPEEYQNKMKKEATEYYESLKYHVAFFESFIEYVKENNLPLDFFSHHSYLSVKDTVKMQLALEKRLEELGLGNIEIHMNEWSVRPSLEAKDSCNAAHDLAMLCAMQDTKMSVMCFYDARMKVNGYSGLFTETTMGPLATYFAFKAFGELYEMGNQSEVMGLGEGVYATAAVSADKKIRGFVITSIDNDETVTTNLPKDMAAYLIDENHYMTKVKLNAGKFKLNKNEVIFFTNKEIKQYEEEC